MSCAYCDTIVNPLPLPTRSVWQVLLDQLFAHHSFEYFPATCSSPPPPCQLQRYLPSMRDSSCSAEYFQKVALKVGPLSCRFTSNTVKIFSSSKEYLPTLLIIEEYVIKNIRTLPMILSEYVLRCGALLSDGLSSAQRAPPPSTPASALRHLTSFTSRHAHYACMYAYATTNS
jgi:hypothetical protein